MYIAFNILYNARKFLICYICTLVQGFFLIFHHVKPYYVTCIYKLEIINFLENS